MSKKLPLDTSKIARYIWLGRRDINWYQDCEAAFVSLFGRERLSLVAQLFAATSINTSLKANIYLFRKALSEIQRGVPTGNYLPNIKTSIERVRRGEELSGRKIRSFAAAMSGNRDAVVVDIWICRAFGINKKYKVGGKDAVDEPQLADSLTFERRQLFTEDGEEFQGLIPTVLAGEDLSRYRYTGTYRNGSPSDGQYTLIENYIRGEAKAMGIEARQLCAMIWGGVRMEATGDQTSHYKEILTHSLTNLFGVL